MQNIRTKGGSAPGHAAGAERAAIIAFLDGPAHLSRIASIITVPIIYWTELNADDSARHPYIYSILQKYGAIGADI